MKWVAPGWIDVRIAGTGLASCDNPQAGLISLGFDCVPSFHSGEVSEPTGEGSVTGRAERAEG
jgi:hypothetical protein